MDRNIRIPLSNPDIGPGEKMAVLDTLNSGRLSLGPVVPRFEELLAQHIGARFAVAVNSGTSGLHLCVKAAAIGDGDEVITTPFSFVASANCILLEGGVPRFVDIDPVTLNIDPELIEAALGPRTHAILPVHIFGRPCPMHRIMSIAVTHGLAVIEDACEAIGATIDGQFAGTFGQTGVFAFYPNKQITTGEGGIIVTEDEAIATLCRSWRNQGRGGDGNWLVHERLGYNYRLSDLNCALGTVQIQRLDEILSIRAAVADKYTRLLADRVPDVITPAPAEFGTSISWFVYVVRLRDEFSAQDRNEVVRKLRDAGIGCNNYFPPIHLQPFYAERFGYKPGAFPVTEHTAERTIALPFFNRLGDAEIEIVCESFADAIASLRRRGGRRKLVAYPGSASLR